MAVPEKKWHGKQRYNIPKLSTRSGSVVKLLYHGCCIISVKYLRYRHSYSIFFFFFLKALRPCLCFFYVYNFVYKYHIICLHLCRPIHFTVLCCMSYLKFDNFTMSTHSILYGNQHNFVPGKKSDLGQWHGLQRSSLHNDQCTIDVRSMYWCIHVVGRCNTQYLYYSSKFKLFSVFRFFKFGFKEMMSSSNKLIF